MGNTSALIVAKPTRMRDGLRTLLRAIPQIELVAQVDDGLAAMKAVTADQPPVFLILELNLLNDQLKTIINQAKVRSPKTRCIVLIDKLKEQESAWANGADEVLLAGFPATKLFDFIESMLSNGNPEILSSKKSDYFL